MALTPHRRTGPLPISEAKQLLEPLLSSPKVALICGFYCMAFKTVEPRWSDDLNVAL